MAAVQAAETHGDEWGLTPYFLWGIYTWIPTWTHSQNWLAAAEDILPWKNISQMITKTISISTRIVISYAMKRGIPLWIWWKVSENWDNNMIRTSQWRESHCRKNASVRRNKSKRAGLWESGIGVGKLIMWVRAFEIITEFTRWISSARIGKSVLIMDVKVSKDKWYW